MDSGDKLHLGVFLIFFFAITIIVITLTYCDYKEAKNFAEMGYVQTIDPDSRQVIWTKPVPQAERTTKR